MFQTAGLSSTKPPSALAAAAGPQSLSTAAGGKQSIESTAAAPADIRDEADGDDWLDDGDGLVRRQPAVRAVSTMSAHWLLSGVCVCVYVLFTDPPLAAHPTSAGTAGLRFVSSTTLHVLHVMSTASDSFHRTVCVACCRGYARPVSAQ